MESSPTQETVGKGATQWIVWEEGDPVEEHSRDNKEGMNSGSLVKRGRNLDDAYLTMAKETEGRNCEKTGLNFLCES